MGLPEWLRRASVDDLPENARELAECVGVKAALALMERHGGAALYVPKLDATCRRARNRRIMKEYNGYNARQLATRYGVSESWVRRLVNGERLDDLPDEPPNEPLNEPRNPSFAAKTRATDNRRGVQLSIFDAPQ